MEYIKVKSILSPLKHGSDPYFGIKYNMNLYRGCQHGCIYCDSRSKVYQLGDLNHIRIKKNAPELLEQKLKRLKNKGTIGTGSMNDPYMPIENKQELTKCCLDIISKYRYPVHIITKSNLVIRDIDLLKKISEIYAAVSFTITCAADNLSKKLEPNASVSSERLAAMRYLSQLGIYTGAVLTPVLPFITDTKQNIEDIVLKVAKAGGKYIIAWMGMTQREGQREYFYHALDKSFPGIRTRYESLFKNSYQCPSPKAEELHTFLKEKCQTYGIATRMEFYKPDQPKQLDLF